MERELILEYVLCVWIPRQLIDIVIEYDFYFNGYIIDTLIYPSFFKIIGNYFLITRECMIFICDLKKRSETLLYKMSSYQKLDTFKISNTEIYFYFNPDNNSHLEGQLINIKFSPDLTHIKNTKIFGIKQNTIKEIIAISDKYFAIIYYCIFEIEIWCIETKTLKYTINMDLPDCPSSIIKVLDDSFLILYPHTMLICDIETREIKFKCEDNDGTLFNVHKLNNNKMISISYHNRRNTFFKIWNINDGTLIINKQFNYNINYINFLDSKIAGISSEDKFPSQIIIIDINTLDIIHTFDPETYITDLKFLPNSDIITCDTHSLKIWDTQTFTLKKEYFTTNDNFSSDLHILNKHIFHITDKYIQILS